MTKIKLITCVGVEQDLGLLPHFINYYKELGISSDNFHPVLQASEDGTEEMKQAIAMLDGYGIKPQEVWIAPYTSKSMWEKRQEVQRKVANKNDWIISADVDEFHEFPVDLKQFLAYCDKRQVNCIQGVFIDRLAPEGKLAPVRSNTSVWEQFPIQADVMCTIRQHEEGNWTTGTVNVMACKGAILPALGGHNVLAGEVPTKHLYGMHLGKLPGIGRPKIRFAVPLRVHHFKWTDRLSVSLKKRLSTPGVSESGKVYGEALLNHIDGPGRIQVEKMPVRIPGYSDRLPWKYQLQAFARRVLRIRIASKLKRIVSK